MSNKYRLIKTYPGSPKAGSIIDNLENDWIENYSEFWELVVEKDYEILEIQGKYGSISSYIESLDNDLKEKSIYKVKRLSDDLIITVGDDVIGKTCSTPNKILFIKILNNKIRLYPRNSFYNLEDIIKTKQKLFTTEDGVDIFKGDKTYYVFNDLTPECNSGFKCKWKVRGGFYQNYQVNQGNEYYKVFSTKEKAEEYILMNKPCLSINEIQSLFKRSIKENEMINLVKSKIQQSV